MNGRGGKREGFELGEWKVGIERISTQQYEKVPLKVFL